MQEHSGRYLSIADFFAQYGIAVLVYDQPGHGKSVSDKKYFGFFQTIDPAAILLSGALKMSDLLLQKYPSLPHFILGHSMGSFITRIVLQKSENRFNGAVIVGTGGRMYLTYFLKKYFSIANNIAPYSHTVFNALFGFINNWKFRAESDDLSWLSVNPLNRESFSQDMFCGIPFTNNGYYALFSLHTNATKTNWAKNIPKSLPLLFISGQDDPIGAFGKGVKETVKALRVDGFNDIQMELYTKMRHEILNEEIRTDILEYIYNWMLSRTKL